MLRPGCGSGSTAPSAALVTIAEGAAADGCTGGPKLWASRTPALGRIASTQRGAYQFQWPSSRIVAGTSSARTIVASRKTATTIPNPNALTNTTSAVTNEIATTMMI